MKPTDIPPGVFAFSSDGVKLGPVGQVLPDRFEVQLEGRAAWVPVELAREITAGKLELALSAQEASRLPTTPPPG